MDGRRLNGLGDVMTPELLCPHLGRFLPFDLESEMLSFNPDGTSDQVRMEVEHLQPHNPQRETST